MGLVLLVIGAELLVRAALRLATRLHVRPLIIGLSLVAFGSTAPQLTVSLQAAYQGHRTSQWAAWSAAISSMCW